MVHNGGVGLADTGSFEDDEVETGGLGNGFGVFYIFGNRKIRLAGGQRAHENARVINGVHADAVAEQSTARSAFGGVNGNNGQCFAGEVVKKPADDFVHKG